ncbi:MAG TPA: NADH-quinone oxidoreductase subunit M [Candidatus Acidoferrales bacterium]|nr:NADH-quinone oxidoreductase subunit M [Candidatus Acidoferrales bacterium]
MPELLLQILLVPIAFIFLAYVAGLRWGAKAGWISCIALAYSTVLTLISGWEGGVQEFYNWKPIGFFGFNADGLSVPILFTIALLCTLMSVYSIPYMQHIIGDDKKQFGLYNALLLLYSVGMMGAVLATNLIEFYLFFELMLIPSYFLIAKWGYGDRDRISFMYFMWTHIGALAFLAGILSVGYLTGSFDLATIVTETIPANLRIWIVLLMVVGLMVKMATFGLHIWLPYAHAEAPTPISALLSPAMIGIGGYAIVRIVMTILPTAFQEVSLALTVWAVVTMFYGGAMALVQDDIKRLLAYSSVSQMGYVLLGIASVQVLGVSGSMFQYVTHGLGKGILFMVAGAIILQTHGLRSISKMGGLASKMPITATAALIGFLTIMGVPPTSGFISEFLIFLGSFKAAFATGSMLRLGLSILGVISTVLTAGYSLWAAKRIFFGKLPSELSHVTEPPITVTVPLLILSAIAVLIGIFPDLVEGLLLPAVKVIVGG